MPIRAGRGLLEAVTQQLLVARAVMRFAERKHNAVDVVPVRDGCSIYLPCAGQEKQFSPSVLASVAET